MEYASTLPLSATTNSAPTLLYPKAFCPPQSSVNIFQLKSPVSLPPSEGVDCSEFTEPYLDAPPHTHTHTQALVVVPSFMLDIYAHLNPPQPTICTINRQDETFRVWLKPRPRVRETTKEFPAKPLRIYLKQINKPAS